MTKICNTCDIEKDETDFHKAKNTKDGYSGKCKECAKTASRRWRANNRERHREYTREYNKLHNENYKAYQKQYRKENKKRLREVRKLWEIKTRQKRLADKRADSRKRYLGRNNACYDYAQIIKHDPCSYCNAPPISFIDHIIPLSKGGRNIPENLTAACLSCNSSKRDKSLVVFLLSK